jgi:hypothetical protein
MSQFKHEMHYFLRNNSIRDIAYNIVEKAIPSLVEGRLHSTDVCLLPLSSERLQTVQFASGTRRKGCLMARTLLAVKTTTILRRPSQLPLLQVAVRFSYPRPAHAHTTHLLTRRNWRSGAILGANGGSEPHPEKRRSA